MHKILHLFIADGSGLLLGFGVAFARSKFNSNMGSAYFSCSGKNFHKLSLLNDCFFVKNSLPFCQY